MGTSLVSATPEPVAVTETASTAVAAQAKAAVEARYVMALRNPRSWDQVRVKLLETCRRPSFAAVAKYAKPTGGKKLVGPSIRFAEEAARQMGNILAETIITFDDDDRRIVKVMVTDLESNLSYPQDIILEKTVERKDKSGRTVLSERKNSYNETVYVVVATEDEMATKQGAQVSKAMRNGLLRVLPGDILDEAMAEVGETVKKADAEDPAGARKKLCDAFFDLGVMPGQIVEFLGHPLDQMNPSELQLLRNIYTAIREGEGSWSDVMAEKGKKAEAPKQGNAGVAAKLAQKKKGEEPPPVDPDLEFDKKLAEAE